MSEASPRLLVADVPRVLALASPTKRASQSVWCNARRMEGQSVLSQSRADGTLSSVFPRYVQLNLSQDGIVI